MARRRIRKREMKRIAETRIQKLFSLAKITAMKKKPSLARRYVELACRIGMRYNVPIPGTYRNFYCKRCNSYLLPGRNSKTRLNRGIQTITCLSCSNSYRHPYLREQKKRRKGKKTKKANANENGFIKERVSDG